MSVILHRWKQNTSQVYNIFVEKETKIFGK